MLRKIISILFVCSFSCCFAYTDSLEILPNLAETAYLQGKIDKAAQYYQRALDIALSDDIKAIKVERFLKNAELLALCLKDLGSCNITEDYIEPILKSKDHQAAVSRVIGQILKCHAHQGTVMSQSLQSKVLTFFDLNEIDEGAHIQLADFLNGAYSEEKEFDDFFYLIEYGYVPASKSLRLVQESNKKARYRLILAAASSIMVIVLGFLLWAIQRQKAHLTKEKVALLTGKVKETSRLSVDLHDVLGYKIIEIKDKASKMVTERPEHKTQLMNGLDELHHSMRYIVQSNLTPESLKLGLGPALDTLFNRVIKLGTVKFNLYKHGLEKRVDTAKEKHIFYIIQELVNNIIKHSRASTATFEVSRLENELVILAEDNGIGYTPSIETLKTIKTRTDFLKGKVVEDTALDKGCTIIVNIPL